MFIAEKGMDIETVEVDMKELLHTPVQVLVGGEPPGGTSISSR